MYMGPNKKGNGINRQRVCTVDNLKKYFVSAAVAGLLCLGTAQVSFGQDLIENGDFENFTATSTNQASQGGSGLNMPNFNPAYTTGDTLTDWANNGYAFVFTTTNSLEGGTITGQDGAFSLWGPRSTPVSNNGLTAPPGGGNVVAEDGVYEIGALSQVVTGLTPGKTYEVSFEWAAAQQSGYTEATTENWTVLLGAAGLTTGQITSSTNAQTTTTYDLPSKGFSGWMSQTFEFTNNTTSTSETLYFLADGTPTGEPPFSLLADVSMVAVPEPIASSFWTLLFGMLIMFGNRAWHRYQKRPSTNT
jgi:hypothetical protein